MPLFKSAFDDVLYGQKSVIGRAPDHENPAKDYRTMRFRDILEFFLVDSENGIRIRGVEAVRRKVSFVNHHSCVRNMLMTEGLAKLLPGVESVGEGVEIYHSFPGYEERIGKFGIYAIGIGDRVG